MSLKSIISLLSARIASISFPVHTNLEAILVSFWLNLPRALFSSNFTCSLTAGLSTKSESFSSKDVFEYFIVLLRLLRYFCNSSGFRSGRREA